MPWSAFLFLPFPSNESWLNSITKFPGSSYVAQVAHWHGTLGIPFVLVDFASPRGRQTVVQVHVGFLTFFPA